ncbi:MAG: response regulator [Caldilineaceae bacterium]|nr:response regulator [Caldilineaceae bacterium]
MATHTPHEPIEATTRQCDFISTTPKIGDVIEFRIVKLLPFGIVGTLPDGARGVIREREISWQEERRGWQTKFSPGSSCQARIIDQRQEQWELSLRMAEYDPWIQLTGDNLAGHAVRGTVTGFSPDLAYVELDNGLRAFLAEEALPPWVSEPIHEALWLGDRIHAKVKRIVPCRREIYVSMQGLSDIRWSTNYARTSDEASKPQSVNGESEWTANSFLVAKDIDDKSSMKNYLQRRLSVLVIEDDAVQNKAIVTGLSYAGHQVEGVLSSDDGLMQIRNGTFDFVICDVNLGEQDGIAMVQKMSTEFPEVRYLLITDWMTANYREADLLALSAQGVPLLIKPVIPDEFLLALAEPEHYLVSTQTPTRNTRQQLFTMRKQTDVRHSTRRELFGAVRQLRIQSKASKAVLFRLDVAQHAIHIVAQDGRRKLKREALPQLIYSPVRDVAEDRQQTIINDVADVEAYARYLIPLLDFRSCIGIPVPADVRDRYALFLFHEESKFPTKAILRDVQIAAKLIGILLERQLFHEQNADLQRTLLMGHLSRGLIHETNHQMSPILFVLSDLADQCRAIEYGLSYHPSQAKAKITEMSESIAQLTENMRKLVKTTRLFARIAVQDSEEPLRMDQVIEQSLDLVRDAANRAHIHLHTSFPNHPMITQLKQTQVQQVLVNLLLNAIQQIERIRTDKGHIQVVLELAHATDSTDVIKVTVEDDGPGIHHRQWEQIFELGMTTRMNDGSGMGLYISRRLMEDCGGRLYVGSSYLHWGTSMVAEFPIYLPVD